MLIDVEWLGRFDYRVHWFSLFGAENTAPRIVAPFPMAGTQTMLFEKFAADDTATAGTLLTRCTLHFWFLCIRKERPREFLRTPEAVPFLCDAAGRI